MREALAEEKQDLPETLVLERRSAGVRGRLPDEGQHLVQGKRARIVREGEGNGCAEGCHDGPQVLDPCIGFGLGRKAGADHRLVWLDGHRNGKSPIRHVKDLICHTAGHLVNLARKFSSGKPCDDNLLWDNLARGATCSRRDATGQGTERKLTPAARLPVSLRRDPDRRLMTLVGLEATIRVGIRQRGDGRDDDAIGAGPSRSR